jgi:uncharacterized repeat protein (TIGR01451 family)
MRGFYAIAGVGVLGVCLAGWAALALGQSNLGKLPPSENPSAEAEPTGQAAPPAKLPDPEPQGPATGNKADPVPSGPGVVPSAPPLPLTPTMPATPTPSTPAVSTQPEPDPDKGLRGAGEEAASQPSMTPGNTTGRQEPAISIEWIGPPTAKVGQAADYTLVVRNACNIPVQEVLVRVRVPNGLTVSATEPKAEAENNVQVWKLGTLLAKQEKNLQMKLVAEARGDVMPQAWVTFTGSSVMSIKVREPKLLVKASSPEKVLVGDAAAFTLTVSNPGDGSADGVKVHALLSEGLEHARGNKVDFEIGNLAAGETRSVQLICATRTGGAQKCEGVAEADGGLTCRDTANVNVITPRLDLALSGPALRYLERKALYTLKVTNPGDAPATNVTVGDTVPAGFKVLAASDGGRHDFSTRTVSWFLGEIGPGQTREVKLEVQAINPGEFKHKATAVGARGLRAESDLMTRVEGVSALLLEMVDTEDPIEVGGDTAYEVRITNTGSKTETDIKLIATVPDKMDFKGAQGPVRYKEEGKTVVFEPLEKLAPRADAIFRINVKAKEAGTVNFKIQMTSTNLTDPVIKMEATRIYSDSPEAPAKPQ